MLRIVRTLFVYVLSNFNNVCICIVLIQQRIVACFLFRFHWYELVFECLMELLLFILFPVCVCCCLFHFVYSILNSVWFVNYVWLSMRWLFQGYLSIDALHTFIVAIFNQLIQQTANIVLASYESLRFKHTIYALCGFVGFGFSVLLLLLVLFFIHWLTHKIYQKIRSH